MAEMVAAEDISFLRQIQTYEHFKIYVTIENIEPKMVLVEVVPEKRGEVEKIKLSKFL